MKVWAQILISFLVLMPSPSIWGNPGPASPSTAEVFGLASSSTVPAGYQAATPRLYPPPPPQTGSGDINLDDPGLDHILYGSGPVAAAPAGAGMDLDDPNLDQTLFGGPAGQPAPGLPGNTATIADPLEKWNRWIFDFNDWFYTALLQPAVGGYIMVVPVGGREAVENFFDNLSTPGYFVNDLLQGRLRSAGTQITRFGINTTLGIAGLLDVAQASFDITREPTGLGDTLEQYGVGNGFYIIWPMLGPSTLRETVGMVGDNMLSPVTYCSSGGVRAGLTGLDSLDTASRDLPRYYSLKELAFDPYVSLRDAYVQSTSKRNQTSAR